LWFLLIVGGIIVIYSGFDKFLQAFETVAARDVRTGQMRLAENLSTKAQETAMQLVRENV